MSKSTKKQLTVMIDGQLKDRIKADHPTKAKEPLGEFVETAIRNELKRRERIAMQRFKRESARSRQADEPDEQDIAAPKKSVGERTAGGGRRNVRSTRGLGG